MAALHTWHGAGQGLRVLARDRTGGSTAVVAPLALVPALLQVPLLTVLGCADPQTGRTVIKTLGNPMQPWTDSGRPVGVTAPGRRRWCWGNTQSPTSDHLGFESPPTRNPAVLNLFSF